MDFIYIAFYFASTFIVMTTSSFLGCWTFKSLCPLDCIAYGTAVSNRNTIAMNNELVWKEVDQEPVISRILPGQLDNSS